MTRPECLGTDLAASVRPDTLTHESLATRSRARNSWLWLKSNGDHP